jgi:hypothetical protein
MEFGRNPHQGEARVVEHKEEKEQTQGQNSYGPHYGKPPPFYFPLAVQLFDARGAKHPVVMLGHTFPAKEPAAGGAPCRRFTGCVVETALAVKGHGLISSCRSP